MGRDRIFISIMIAILIFLSVTLILGIAGNGTTATDRWSFSTNDSQSWSNIYVGDDGTLYTIGDSAIVAIGTGGNVKWRMPAVEGGIGAGVSGYNNTVFLRVWGDLLAISPAGQLIWRQSLLSDDIAGMTVTGDKLYVLGSRRIDIYDCGNGSRLRSFSWTFWITFDAEGNLYSGHDDSYETTPQDRHGVLEAYDPDIGLLWRHDLREYGIDYRQFVYGSVRVVNDTLMVTDGYRLASVNYDGDLLWQTNISPGAALADIDSDGFMYFLRYDDQEQRHPRFDIIGPDRSLKAINDPAHMIELGDFYAISNGIAYYAKTTQETANLTLADLDVSVVSAYDLRDEKVLWTREIGFEPQTRRLNGSNIEEVMFNVDVHQANQANNVTPVVDWNWLEPEPEGMKNRSRIDIMVDGNVAYVNYWAYNYLYPFIFDQSACAYAGGICALDASGRVIWSKRTDAYVTSMATRNGTIVYWTNDGRISSTGAEVAAGFALAAFYLFFRFFVLGAVSRARTRVNQNENRVRLLDFIARDPGATLYDMARGLGINVGTVRYHLFVLSANHKVKACRDRRKHVRYFVNRGEYTEDEMLVMSLMKREQIGKLLNILMSSPGASNADISLALGLSDSAVSRYMRELADRGVVEKRRSANGRLSYVLEDRFRDAIAGLGNHDSTMNSESLKTSGRTVILAATADE